MKPIVLWELNQRTTYLLWWTVGTVAIITLLLLIYPSIHAQADQLNKVLNQLPVSLRSLKTGGSEVDITSPVGYLHSQLYYITLPIIQIMMAVGLGSSLLARDEQNHTLELLLARPVSRSKLLAAKALSGLVLVFAVNVIATVFIVVLSKAVNLEINSLNLVMASLYTTLFSLSFGMISFALSAASLAARRASIAIPVVIALGGYLLASLSSLSHTIEVPAKFLPYHYFTPTQILEGHVVTSLNIYLAGVAIITVLVAWLGFRRRDIS